MLKLKCLGVFSPQFYFFSRWIHVQPHTFAHFPQCICLCWLYWVNVNICATIKNYQQMNARQREKNCKTNFSKRTASIKQITWQKRAWIVNTGTLLLLLLLPQRFKEISGKTFTHEHLITSPTIQCCNKYPKSILWQMTKHIHLHTHTHTHTKSSMLHAWKYECMHKNHEE